MNENSSADIWRFVAGKETAIANHLRSLAPVLPSTVEQRVTRVARELERIHKRGGVGDLNAQHKALADPDLLAIVSPLLERARDDHNDNTAAESELLSDLQVGVCRLVRCSGERTSIVGIFAYPGLLLIGLIGIMLLFSQFILPSFRTVLIEFGIELPTVTKVMFAIGSFLETAWPLVVFAALLAALPMIVELCRSMGIATGSVRWVEDKLSSKRSAMATWARHTALLLQSGINQDTAVKTSMSAAKRWIRSGVWPWRFGLVEEVLKLEDESAKIAVLNHAADYYHSRHRSVVQWWASFLPTTIICLLGVLVLFVMLSILMPLVAIISGLTGGVVVGL